MHIPIVISLPLSRLRNDNQFFAFCTRTFLVSLSGQPGWIGAGKRDGTFDSVEPEEFAKRSFLADIRADDVGHLDGRVFERGRVTGLVVENGSLGLSGCRKRSLR